MEHKDEKKRTRHRTPGDRTPLVANGSHISASSASLRLPLVDVE